MYCLVVQVGMFLCYSNMFSFNFITFSSFYSGSISPLSLENYFSLIYFVCCAVSFFLSNSSFERWELIIFRKVLLSLFGPSQVWYRERTMPVLCPSIYHSQFCERGRVRGKVREKKEGHPIWFTFRSMGWNKYHGENPGPSCFRPQSWASKIVC